MFDSATSTLDYRPAFGRRAPRPQFARDGFYAPDARRGVDAITAELRQRILAAVRVRPPVPLAKAR